MGLLSLLTGSAIFINSKASFKLPQDKNILVIGDSHTECAIDDNIFTRSVNVSQSGTAYLYTYCKLKKFLDENPQIDTVLLSFHYRFTKYIENSWMFSDEIIADKIPAYITLMSKEELLIYLNNETFIKSILQMPQKNLKSILKFIQTGNISHTDLNIGKYLRLDRDNLQEDINNYNKISTYQQNEILSEYQTNYLLKIAALCKTKQVELILINTPMYNVHKYGNIEELNNFYDTYLKGTKYLDCSGYSLPDSCYGDVGHLNYKGAEVFSLYLRDNLQNKEIVKF
jgi:hypothetical protein